MAGTLARRPNKRYLTTSEAADLLGVHPVTITRWDKAGKLHSFRTHQHLEQVPSRT